VTQATSFRDPGGQVSVTKDRVIRTVFQEGLGNLDACLNSAAARALVEKGDLIATRVIEPATGDAGQVVVEHPRIPFASYAHEWPPDMLHAAGRLTLEICIALLEEGRGLKDATPGNVLFRGSRPVFIDVLSIEDRNALDPIWLADAQFARTFLIPLLLHRRTGYPLHQLFLFERDGIAPEDAVHRLPAPRRWFPPDLGLVTIPASASSLESEKIYRPRRARDEGEARFILAHHFKGLRKKLDKLAPQPSGVKTAPASEITRKFLEGALREMNPVRVLDAASNTGEFSHMAATAGAFVVAIDRNPENAGALWRSASATGIDILPLVVDFARPTPAAGWRCAEHAGFLDRAEGFFDCVLVFDCLHHFMVADQIPPDRIFDVLATLTTGWLAIEYIGPEDAQFRRLARGRDALYRKYGKSAFEDCSRRSFEIVNSVDVPSSDRALYLMRRKF
jgi:hypothetical protein